MSVDKDAVYYDAGGIETIAIIQSKLTPEQFQGFLLGNALKYLCRANHKENFKRDLYKAQKYIEILQGTSFETQQKTE